MGCGGSTATVDGRDSTASAVPDASANHRVKSAAPVKQTAQTPMQKRLNAIEYDERVKIWAKRFGKPESWVRKHTSPKNSAAEAETRLIRARVQKKRR